MADFKIYQYHLRQYACNQKTKGELRYYKTVYKFELDRFLIFILVRHVTFKLRVDFGKRVFRLTREESTDSPVRMGLIFDNVSACTVCIVIETSM